MTNVEIGKRINEIHGIRPVDAAALRQIDEFFALLTREERTYAASYGAGMASVELRTHFKRFD